MAFETPSLDENHAFLLLLLVCLMPSSDTTEGSFYWLFLKTLAAAAASNDAHIDATKDELLEDTAVDNLPRFADLQPGGPIPRKTATPARKARALRVSGAATTLVPANATLTSTSGLTYRIERADVVGPGLYVDVDIVSVDVGAATRLTVGSSAEPTELTFTDTPAGLEDTAKLVLDLDEGGDDLEPIEAWRSRILLAKRSKARGGTADNYVAWILSKEAQDAGVSCAAAFALPTRNGRGTVDVVGLHAGTGNARTLEAPERADLQAFLDGVRPVTAAVRVLETVTDAIDVEYLIVETEEPQYAFDWDDSAGWAVLSYGVTAPDVLKFQGGTRPPDLEAGHHLSLYPISNVGGTGAERRVSALGPGLDEVTLEADDTGDVPKLNDSVFAGGPLVEPVRQAILALLNSLGPANPGKVYGPWEGSLRPKSIERVAAAVPGVTDDGNCINPVAVVEADDPAPYGRTIGLLVPGRISVHRSNS